MSVKVRLRRIGSNKRPFFRVVVADGRSPLKGRFIENVGWYDPQKKGRNFSLDTDRIQYWKDHGAQISDTVVSLLRKTKKAAPAVAAPTTESAS